MHQQGTKATTLVSDVTRSFRSQLTSALRSSEKNGLLSEHRFFEEWFRDRGQALFFLFRKNLSVTNIQFAELLSLIRTHLSDRETEMPVHNQQVLSLESFLGGVKAIFEVHRTVAEVLHFHSATLHRTVLAEPFYGSCTIFVPPHLKLDYKRVCAESGYVHSVGINLHSRLLEATSVAKVAEDLKRYLRNNPEELGTASRILFRPFASEDFTPYDREQAGELKQGLDDVKLHFEKYHIGGLRLVSAIRQLQRLFKKQLVFPGPGPFHQDVLIDEKNRDRSQTIWLLIEKRVSERTLLPARERFLICYAQLYKNENPFGYFDENKPAWSCHTTLPHSLAAAMINLTRPWTGKNSAKHALDPFCGSGTIWLESLRFPGLVLQGADIEPISGMLAHDNLWFFSRTSDELKDLEEYLSKVMAASKKTLLPAPHKDRGSGDSIRRNYARAISLYMRIFGNDREASRHILRTHVRDLGRSGYFTRILFYIALRVRYRHYAELLRHERQTHSDEAWTQAFAHELRIMQSQISKFHQMRRSAEQNANDTGSVPRNSECYREFIGDYSLSVTLDLHYLRRCFDSNMTKRKIVKRNAIKEPPRLYDLIVTDPPYGFNTTDDPHELGGVYAKAIPTMIRSLKDGGHLVLCLPEVSYTGKKLPAFTQRALVTYQVLSTADVLNKEVVVEARLLPRPTRLFSPPFYWESERALRRTILHFRFRDKRR